jgi:hypothetical protein
MQVASAPRNHKFDGSERRKGLSKLMVDISIPIKEIDLGIKPEDRDSDRLQAIIEQVTSEMGLTIDQLKGKTRHPECVTGRAIAFFIARMTTDLSLIDVGRELSTYLPKHHSTVIYGVNMAFDLIQRKDKEFGVLFYRIRQRLEAHNDILFDLNDFERLPMWYKERVKEYYGIKNLTRENLPFIEEIRTNPDATQHQKSSRENKAQYEAKVAEQSHITDKEIRQLAREKGILIDRKWEIPNTMWWIVNELGEYETRLGNTNEACKQSLLNL